jgi:hypothetical protein
LALALDKTSKLTFQVDLPGGRDRLREAILYICVECVEAPTFGLTKLNKILWLADFTSFAERAQPVTGRAYQRLKFGPAPVEMLLLLNEMLKDNEIEMDKPRLVTFDERRPRSRVAPSLRNFSLADLKYLDNAIEQFWTLTGREVSERSHGIAWRTRSNGDAMPYELSYFDDSPLGANAKDKLMRYASAKNLRSQ